MGCAASLSAKYLPLPKIETGNSQASSSPKAAKSPEAPKQWTRTELGQLSVPQLVRWVESLRLDLTLAIKAETAKERLWREIQEARPSALEQVRALEDLEHWPLPETLRWLDYFGALDDSVAPKEKLIGLLLEHKEELAAPEDESAEATFLTEVQRHVAMVRQAAVTIIAQLGEQLQEAEVEERRRHPWFANGKALVDFKPKELSGAEEMKIPFVELNAGDEVDLTVHPSGWAWIVLKSSSHGWAPASSVTEVARALQDYGAEEAESMGCREGDEFEVILRHYSGWSLCRRPQSSQCEGLQESEGWLPDNCLSDHPRNAATKQQQLILAGLQRLSGDVNEVEATLYRIQTEGAAEDDSLQSLHSKVCDLAEEYRKIVAVLQANPHLLAQEEQAVEEVSEATSSLLPSWVRVSAHCYYVSKTQKKLMSVTVQRVCEVRRQILVTFDSDRNARKIVAFEAFQDMASCPLQPKEKAKKKERKRHAKHAVESAEDELAEELQGIIQELGPVEQLSGAVSDTESSYESSDYTASTASGEFDRHASMQESGSSAEASEARETAARRIQVAYRHFLQRTATFSKAELPRPPMAPLSPERRHGAACLVKSVLRSYLAKETLQRLRLEAQVEKAQEMLVAVMQRFLVQLELLNWRQLLGTCQRWQGALRSYQARQRLQALRCQAAAVRLQSAQRGLAARRELQRRRARRDGLQLLSPSKHRAVRQLQRFLRRYAAQATLLEAERWRRSCAVRIQAAWRGRRSRQETAEEMKTWQTSRYQAACRLQSMAKAVGARKQLRQSMLARGAAAQWIQTSWRGHAARRRVAPWLVRRQHAAARVQGLQRMVQARRKAEQVREERLARQEAMAVRIQSAVRGCRARQEVQPLLLERRAKAMRLQRCMRRLWAYRRLQQLRQERASIKVQSSWRRQLAKGEALRRRARAVDDLLSSLLEGGDTSEVRGETWLEKVLAAMEWKAQREEEIEEKQLRLRRQNAPQLSREERTKPEGLSVSAQLDRAMVALRLVARRRRKRMMALLQTQCRGAEELHFEKELCKCLALDQGLLIRLDLVDSVAEVAHVLQTAWSIGFQLRTAQGVGGAKPALEVLLTGVRSLKRRLQIDLQGAKVSGVEEAQALRGFLEAAEESVQKAEARAENARRSTLEPLKEELTVALKEGQAAVQDLAACVARVRPEVEAIRAKHRNDAAEAEKKLREEREQKHAQTVALNKIAIRTQIEKERLEAGLVDKYKPKIGCYKRVFANVKELQQELKDLEVSGTANRKSQGILQHTLRALESRAAKAESDSKAKAVFGEAEEDVKDFQPSEKVEKKVERGEEQEQQFRDALESEVKSLHADMDARANYEAGSLGAQLRAEAEAVGEAAVACEDRLRCWRQRCEPLRQWLAEVVPIARGAAVMAAAADFIKVCRSAEAPHPVPATLRAVAKQLATVETAAERAAAESPREGQLSQVLLKLQNGLKALQELRGAFPDMPRSPTRSPNGSPKKLFARDDHDSQPSELPPFPPPHQEPPKVQAKSAAKSGGLSIAGLAELGQNLSALSSLQPPMFSKSPVSPSLSPARPSSAASPGGKAERLDKVSAPLRSPIRPSSASTREKLEPKLARPANVSSGSAVKAVQKARQVTSGWE